jgi:hypothetical protein
LAAVLAAVNITGVVPVAVTAYGNIGSIKSEVSEMIAEGHDTEAIVREYFNDIPVMIQVARCESRFRHTLADGSVLQGEVDPADIGVMQINKRYHQSIASRLGLNLDDLYDNMQYARYLYKKKGTQPWKASAPCWGRTVAMNR